ncbi:23861_t:CDS:1, partial [Entrophospora sp. SA101]
VGKKITCDIYGKMLDEYEETLIVFVGIENNCDSSMYFGGSGKLYKAEHMD